MRFQLQVDSCRVVTTKRVKQVCWKTATLLTGTTGMPQSLKDVGVNAPLAIPAS